MSRYRSQTTNEPVSPGQIAGLFDKMQAECHRLIEALPQGDQYDGLHDAATELLEKAEEFSDPETVRECIAAYTDDDDEEV